MKFLNYDLHKVFAFGKLQMVFAKSKQLRLLKKKKFCVKHSSNVNSVKLYTRIVLIFPIEK